MSTDLAGLRRELPRMLSDLEPLQHAVGLSAKNATLEVLTRHVGSDHRMSNKPVKLSAGYDTGNPVVLHLRPAGLWFLLDDGRKRRGTIRTRRRNGTRAVLTPHGPRASSSYGPSRGLRTLDATNAAVERVIERAALDGITEVLRQGGWI